MHSAARLRFKTCIALTLATQRDIEATNRKGQQPPPDWTLHPIQGCSSGSTQPFVMRLDQKLWPKFQMPSGHHRAMAFGSGDALQAPEKDID
jgi:hypothetical protein